MKRFAKWLVIPAALFLAFALLPAQSAEAHRFRGPVVAYPAYYPAPYVSYYGPGPAVYVAPPVPFYRPAVVVPAPVFVPRVVVPSYGYPVYYGW